MEAIFIKILNMSLTACWMILAAILLRLMLKKAPKNIRFVLWALVGIRLVVPFSFESMFSLIPNPEPIQNKVFSAVTQNISNTPPLYVMQIDPTANTTAQNSQSALQTTDTDISVLSVLAIIWLIGVAAMATYMFFSYGKIRRKVGASLKTDRNVYICDDIDSPFILGILRPKIYLPSDLSEEEKICVIAHENSHIKRLDHIWKPFSFAILSVYWFNPLIWVAYILLCRDIELACDEKVISKMDLNEKRRYSQALLSCSISRRMISACPLAFGEIDVKNRVKSILNYKKPVFWVIIVSTILCLIAGLLFITDPKTEKTLTLPTDGNYQISLICVNTNSKTSIIKPYIRLHSENNTFSFCYSALSSYVPYGIYRINDGQLFLDTSDGLNHYVFDIIAENKVAFNEKESSELPSYKISGDSNETEIPIKDGSIFEITKAELMSDETEYDSEYLATIIYTDPSVSYTEDHNSPVFDVSEISSDEEFLFIYDCHGIEVTLKPYLTLDRENERFTLSYAILSSSGVSGTYEKTETRLICTSDDGEYKYIFHILNKGYLYSREIPFEHPQYNSSTTLKPLVDGDHLLGQELYYSYSSADGTQNASLYLNNEGSKYLMIVNGKGYNGNCTLTPDVLICRNDYNGELFVLDRSDGMYIYNKERSLSKLTIEDNANFIFTELRRSNTAYRPMYPDKGLIYSEYDEYNQTGLLSFSLNDDGTCCFTPNYSTIIQQGTFKRTENDLTLTMESGKEYTFERISVNEYRFNATLSDTDNNIENGTVFKVYGDKEILLKRVSMNNG